MLYWDATSVSFTSKSPSKEGSGQPPVSKGVRTSWEVWCEHPWAAVRVGAGPLQGPLDPSILGNIREQDEADSQVEKAAFSGLGGNVGRFFALP